MRRRNKKRKKQDGFLSPVPFVGLIVVSVTVGLAYVWLGCRCQALGQELKALEQRQATLTRQYQQELYKWTRLKSPRNLNRMLARHGIDMTWPSSRQVVRLREEHLLADAYPQDGGPRYAKVDR